MCHTSTIKRIDIQGKPENCLFVLTVIFSLSKAVLKSATCRFSRSREAWRPDIMSRWIKKNNARYFQYMQCENRSTISKCRLRSPSPAEKKPRRARIKKTVTAPGIFRRKFALRTRHSRRWIDHTEGRLTNSRKYNIFIDPHFDR